MKIGDRVSVLEAFPKIKAKGTVVDSVNKLYIIKLDGAERPQVYNEFELSKIKTNEISGPTKNIEYYNPLERPTRYPLELTDNLHICLWDKEGKFKYTIALFSRDNEGYSLSFIGERPLDDRVNWLHFQELIIAGQHISNKKYDEEE